MVGRVGRHYQVEGLDQEAEEEWLEWEYEQDQKCCSSSGILGRSANGYPLVLAGSSSTKEGRLATGSRWDLFDSWDFPAHTDTAAHSPPDPGSEKCPSQASTNEPAGTAG
jgi:hypothetical protein